MNLKRKKSLKAAINGLKVSREVKKTLLHIAMEVEGAWSDTVKALKEENRRLKKAFQDANPFEDVDKKKSMSDPRSKTRTS